MVQKSLIKVIGIDLSASEKRGSGLCFLDEKLYAKCRTIYKDQEMVEIVKKYKPDIVGIDAPLSLPLGRKNIFRKSNVHFRKCDKQLWELKIKFFPITLGPMRRLTERGIKIRRMLENLGFKVIEVYPGATQDLLGIPRKQKGLEKLKKGLEKFGIKLENRKLTGDELDAVTAAYTAYLFLKGLAIEIGDKREGTIVVPIKEKLNFSPNNTKKI